MIVLTKSGMRELLSEFNAGIFKLKKSKIRMFAAKKISEWRKVAKRSRKLFRTYEKIHGK